MLPSFNCMQHAARRAAAGPAAALAHDHRCECAVFLKCGRFLQRLMYQKGTWSFFGLFWISPRITSFYALVCLSVEHPLKIPPSAAVSCVCVCRSLSVCPSPTIPPPWCVCPSNTVCLSVRRILSVCLSIANDPAAMVCLSVECSQRTRTHILVSPKERQNSSTGVPAIFKDLLLTFL